MDTVLACPNLPSLPAVAVHVLELTQDPNVKLTEIASTIQHDQALASKILRTVNSSYYGLRKGCGTISHALILLGLNPVKTLALGFGLVGTLKKGITDPFDHVSYWRRGLYTAVSAQCLASTVRCGEPEEAFLAGLLQDVGMVALYSALGDRYIEIMAQTQGDHRKLARAERDALDLTHPEVGAQLCEHWRLPASLVTPIRYHERPETATEEPIDIVRCVGIGNLIADVLTTDDPAPVFKKIYERCEAWFTLSPTESDEILSRAAEGTRELSRLFDISTGPYPDIENILDQANQALIGLSLSASQQADALSEQNAELQEQVNTDALTGAANRGKFNSEIVEAFQRARAGEKVAVIFIDADHFKSVNDTHGHLVGDAVLVELSKRLIEHFTDTGLVCRYGGEEFAVILPDVDRITAAKLAESAREKIASNPIDLSHVPDAPETVKITVSMGVSAMGPDTAAFFTDHTQLVNAADRAVYAAKQSGRNCVRIFKPKLKAAA
ncbi:MAG: GGDEF domain-containing protein [Phycisphaerales bacterium]|nr:GGDEF domain-containing protein [Phycisphaerales bacterium]